MTHKLFQKLAKEAQPKSFKAGNYIIRLKEDPAATYTGSVSGFKATRPSAGKQLDAHTSAVKSWVGHLTAKQNAIASKVGVTPVYHYGVAYNGFTAHLTSKQAYTMSKNSDVSSLSLDRSLKVQSDPTPIDLSHSSLGFLKIATDGGLWSKIGGTAGAGKGIVLGDIDTGIAPENPSFAGDALGDAVTAGTTPAIVDGGGVNTVQYKKADGNTFSSTIIPDDSDQGWVSSDLSTKIIAAHYFEKGFAATGKDLGYARGEYLSPRDGAGHGSHTASTAAGDYGVDATVLGHDYGGISGVAPAAKIAVYKVCWDGTATDESLDSCEESDIVAAVNQAVQDGVDVLNFSIGGGAAQTVFSPSDEAFLNATSAGIFVSAAAGNAGPDSSTLDNAAPWETTVAASTIPGYEATATLGNSATYAGASVTVVDPPAAGAITNAPVVDATNAKNPSYDGTDANLCGPGSLDPAKVTGKVVLCDRGVYDRVAKSLEVQTEGGIGMLLVNTPTGANDVESDAHSVPTIHFTNDAYTALHAYADGSNPTVTFTTGNSTGSVTPVPQIADFSSRGPVLAAGSDILKPDVAAPGANILAAVANAPGGDPAWDFYSGTSMATPHVAGLALDYLGVHPLASVSEIKSALMTTATNLVNPDGSALTDPFTEGDGEVNPTSYLTPGLLYLSTPAEWKDYLIGAGEVDKTYPGFSSSTAIDPSNLNLASIAIGNLFGTQTVTRTVTAQSTGTYTATAKVAGITTTVSPSKLVFTKVGQTAKFTVKFTRTGSAALDEYATGSLVWKKSGSSISVRSDIAVNPTSLAVPEEVDVKGVAGSVTVPVTPGANLQVVNFPLIAKSVVTNATGTPAYTATAEPNEHQIYTHTVEGANDTADNSGSEFLNFNVHPIADAPTTDLDLYVAYYAPGETVPTNPTIADLTPNLVGESATTANDETVQYFPDDDQYFDGGTYLTYVDDYAVPVGGTKYAETFTNLTDDSLNTDLFDTSPEFMTTKTGVKTSYKGVWKGLDSNSEYQGLVFNYNLDGTVLYNATFFTFDTSVPVVKSIPTISGTPTFGSTLTAKPAVFDTTDPDTSGQWLRDGVAIDGATATTYVPVLADLGHKLSFQETASVGGGLSTTTVSAPTATVLAATTTSFTFATARITTKAHASVTVTVSAPEGIDTSLLAGGLTVKDGSTTLKFTSAPVLANGTATFSLPLLKKGTHKITIVYAGSTANNIKGSTSSYHSLVVS